MPPSGSAFKCDSCGKQFSCKRYLTKHVLRGHRPRTEVEGELKCSMCPKSFKYLSHLRRHQLSHLNVREFECDQCAAKFVQAAHLAAHVKRKHTESVSVEPTTSRSAAANLPQNAPDVSPREPICFPLTSRSHMEHILCIYCRRRFLSKEDLAEHQLNCNGNGHWSTNERRSSFGVQKNMRGGRPVFHARVHKCSLCSRRFKRICELQSHESTHTRVGTLLCVQCNSVFIQRTQLDRHMVKVHDRGENCDACGEQFRSISQYCSHMRIIHEKLVCSFCGIEDVSRAHREHEHWRRLKEARPVTDPQQPADAILRILVKVDKGACAIEVYRKLPHELLRAFPGLDGLTVHLEDIEMAESASILLCFPVPRHAVQDEILSAFFEEFVLADFRS